jgi:hypothetical protein
MLIKIIKMLIITINKNRNNTEQLINQILHQNFKLKEKMALIFLTLFKIYGIRVMASILIIIKIYQN